MAIRTSGMSIGEIFGEAFRLLKENPVIIVPTLLPFLWLLVVSILGPSMILMVFLRDDPYEVYMTGGYFAIIAGYILFVLIFAFLYMIAEGMTVELVRQAFDEGRGDLRDAFHVTLNRFGSLLLGTLLVGLLVSIGEMIFILPGIILMFLFWFVPQAVMIDEEGGASCLGRSFEFFRENAGDAFVLVLLSVILYAILLLLAWIPVIGAVLLLVGMPYMSSLTTLLYLDRG